LYGVLLAEASEFRSDGTLFYSFLVPWFIVKVSVNILNQRQVDCFIPVVLTYNEDLSGVFIPPYFECILGYLIDWKFLLVVPGFELYDTHLLGRHPTI
jgi:hypothetical protein